MVHIPQLPTYAQFRKFMTPMQAPPRDVDNPEPYLDWSLRMVDELFYIHIGPKWGCGRLKARPEIEQLLTPWGKRVVDYVDHTPTAFTNAVKVGIWMTVLVGYYTVEAAQPYILAGVMVVTAIKVGHRFFKRDQFTLESDDQVRWNEQSTRSEKYRNLLKGNYDDIIALKFTSYDERPLTPQNIEDILTSACLKACEGESPFWQRSIGSDFDELKNTFKDAKTVNQLYKMIITQTVPAIYAPTMHVEEPMRAVYREVATVWYRKRPKTPDQIEDFYNELESKYKKYCDRFLENWFFLEERLPQFIAACTEVLGGPPERSAEFH